VRRDEERQFACHSLSGALMHANAEAHRGGKDVFVCRTGGCLSRFADQPVVIKFFLTDYEFHSFWVR
jgi:hypothetical protein